jgi:hypothetical protein
LLGLGGYQGEFMCIVNIGVFYKPFQNVYMTRSTSFQQSVLGDIVFLEQRMTRG